MAKALSSLAELYHRGRRFEELVSVLTAQSRLLSATPRPNIRLGSISVGRAGSVGAGHRGSPRAASDSTCLAQLSALLESLYARQGKTGRRFRKCSVVASGGSVDEGHGAVLRKLRQISLEKLPVGGRRGVAFSRCWSFQPGVPDAQADLGATARRRKVVTSWSIVLVRHADASHKLVSNKLDEGNLAAAAPRRDLGRQGGSSAGQEAGRRVLELDPNHVRALVSLAPDLPESQHDWARCRRRSKKKRCGWPRHSPVEMAELYHRLGRMESRSQRMPPPSHCYERALRADPTERVEEVAVKRAGKAGAVAW